MPRKTLKLPIQEVDGVSLNLCERQAVMRELAEPYRRANKRDKGKILDYIQEMAGYNRSYAARVLREANTKNKQRGGYRSGSGRKRYYDAPVLQALQHIWTILDFPAGKRLAPYLPEIISALERHKEIKLAPEVRSKLLTISAPPLTVSWHRNVNECN